MENEKKRTSFKTYILYIIIAIAASFIGKCLAPLFV